MRATACARPAASGTIRPLLPSSRISRVPPVSIAAIGTPSDSASSSTRDNGSGHSDGNTRPLARPSARSASSRCVQPRDTSSTPRASASNFISASSEPSPSTTRGRRVPEAAIAGTSRRTPLFSSSLPMNSRNFSGSSSAGASRAMRAVSSASTMLGRVETRSMARPRPRSSAAMASLTASTAPGVQQRASLGGEVGAHVGDRGQGQRPRQRHMAVDALRHVAERALRAKGAAADARGPEAHRPVVAHRHRHALRRARRQGAERRQ